MLSNRENSMENGLEMYNKIKSTEKTLSEIVEKHAPMVKKIAHHLIGRLPNTILVDDLVQAGMIGLLEAAKNYDESKGASFETYAGIRIRGMMLDEVRKGDWVPRSVHKNSRMISETIRTLEHSKGRDAKDAEVAEALQMSISEYHQMLLDSTGSRLYGLDDLLGGAEGLSSQDGFNGAPSDPCDGVHRERLRKKISDEIVSLPERERLVLALYYDEELNLKEIGDVLGVSESRICQIHSQAMIRLQSRMTTWIMDK